MGCHIKNPKDPFQIQCLFPELTKEFSLYFHSSSGQQDLIADCAYKERYECYFIKEGFIVSHDDDNVLKITVPDTSSKQAGRFICQKEGQLLDVSCPFSPSENFTFGSSTTSEVSLRTTGEENFFLGNGTTSGVGLSTTGSDTNPGVIIGAAIGVAVIVILLLVIGILLFKKYKSKRSRECPENNTTDEDQPKANQRQIPIEGGKGEACVAGLPDRRHLYERVHLDSDKSDTPLIDT